MLIALQSPLEVSLPSCAQEEQWLSLHLRKITSVKAIHPGTKSGKSGKPSSLFCSVFLRARRAF